ncbi:hypothetical protein JD844_024882 [Phrynosoma platyrhinos]|uniref:HEAT repeat-containing protein 1 n=1 Tax=Phrynosoma platyrhinos TaxID=52577 RepID=A0ABQ7SYN8_PHRPL|nr:hypothetical protein JD844_024882 [Phrynosoma platyrhinos]
MTSLAHQLKCLALPQNDPSLLSRSEAASLLFDCKEAANIDRETFFAIGCTGLEELIGIDSSFETFQPTLFSQMSKGLERSVQTKAVNQQLDENISLFLIHLSPYFMLKPAQKCLEWLIHRFHIHLYNQDSLVGCVLPYHETKLFVRVIQLLKISDPTHKWHWLHPIQSSAENVIVSCAVELELSKLAMFEFKFVIYLFSEIEEESDMVGDQISIKHLEAIITNIPLEKDMDHLLACKFLEEYISCGAECDGDPSRMTEINKELLPLIRLFERKYPKTLDLVLEEYLKDVRNPKEQDLFHQFISLSLSGGKHQFLEDSDTSLLLSLNHPQPAVRVLAVQHLKEIMKASQEGFDDSFIEEAVLARLKDDNLEVVMSSLGTLETFFITTKTFDEQIGHSLLCLFERADLSKDEKWCKILETAIHLLIKEGMLEKNKEFLNQLVLQLLPFIVITSNDSKSAEWKLALCIAKSGLCSLHPLLKGWPETFQKVVKSAKFEDLIYASNGKLIKLLSENLISKDPSFVSQMMQGLIGIAEKESHNVKQKITVHVISAVIVQLCSDTSQMEECHSSLALMIFDLLSRKMQKFKDKDFLWKYSPSENELFLEVLVAYIQKLNAEGSADLDDSVLLVVLLRNFIQGLVPPDSFLKDEIWWNPETLNKKSKDYLHLLLGLFDTLVHGASEGIHADHFRTMMKLLFEVHLKRPEDQFRFFSVLWTYSYNISNQLNFAVDAVLQTRALYIGGAMLASQTMQTKRKLASTMSPVIVSLLINLGSPVSEVRRAAVNCLNTLSGIKESAFHPVLLDLIQKAEEITSDQTYVIQSLGNLFEELHTQQKQKPQQQKLSEALGALLECAQSSKCPSYVAQNLMKLLQAVNGKIVLSHLLPVIDRLLERVLTKPEEMLKEEALLLHLILGKYNEHSAGLLCTNQQSLDLFIKALHTSQEIYKGLCTFQMRTLGQAFDMSDIKAQDQECIQEESNVNWQRVTLILELLQHKKKLKQPQALIPTLFSLLARCLEPSAGQENLEYVKQLILGGLLNICQKLSPDGSRLKEGILDEEKFNVELIVQCIRVSEMPQTHHHALLLLGTAAGMFPGKVLHNIMPIFTFMGANVMRLDDAYSFQVINKTVKMVIPALIQAEENSDSSETPENLEGVVIKIIRVFVDALPHVPEHRRLPILEQLISTLGGERFLWILLVLLFEQHVTKSVTAVANGEKDTVLETDTEFWISVCCKFSVTEQLHSLMKVLDYLKKLPENNEDDPGQKKSRQHRIKSSSQENELFNVESHSGKQLRHFKFLSVSFTSQLLASQSFVKKVVECEDAEELQEFEQRLLEDVLCYINVVAQSVEKNAASPTAKFWRALLNKSYDVLDKVNALMPTETFIPVIRGLMTNQLPSVRRKAMDLLNNKLQQRTAWQQAQVDLLLEMVPELIAVVQRNTHETEEEQAINRQTALFSLKLLCRCFGNEKPEPFIAVLKMAVDVISSREKVERNVIGSALLCAAEVTWVLKALAIPQLPRFMPALLKILKHKKELVTSEIYLLSAVTALLKIVETLPHFLSPYLLDILLQVVRLEKIAVELGPSSHVNLRLSSLKTTLATKLPPRVLLPAVAKCYNDVANTCKNCLGAVTDILKEHIIFLERDQLSAHQSELTSFFMKALDFRTEHSQDNLEEVGKIEDHIIMCLISMVMKLSEMSFRPLFFKLENMLGGEERFQERVTMHLIPCIAQFAVAMADDSLWKPLNYQILLQMRHDSPKVRFAALLALLEFAEKIRENYMVLLPESIPFLAELMEVTVVLSSTHPPADECEEVEHQCQKTIQQLEAILGEPLQSYF